MAVVLGRAGDAYRAGDAPAAKELVNDAYFGYYEKLGFEATVMTTISGDRATAVEFQFSEIKKAIAAGAAADRVGADLDGLVSMLREDADRLDGQESEPFAILAQALLILLRDGFEAILVVGAIVAYLVKAGHQDKARAVYLGAGAALAASVVLAWLLNTLAALSGASQETIEGFTLLLAVAMLVYVSNWILSKSEADAWSSYIKRKSGESLARGSLFSLAFVAFLAVFREGAEVILLYQALLARSPEDAGQVWLGTGIGVVLLVGVYLAIRFLAIRIPLRPFFLATSVLLAVMAFSFAGTGVKRLQTAGMIPSTPIPGGPSVDLLGVYATVETLAAQGVAIVLLVVLSFVAIRRARTASAVPLPEAAPVERSETPGDR